MLAHRHATAGQIERAYRPGTDFSAFLNIRAVGDDVDAYPLGD